MASEATKMLIRGNMLMDIRVIEVTEFNSEVKLNFWGHYHCCSRVPRATALLLLCALLVATSQASAPLNSAHTFNVVSS